MTRLHVATANAGKLREFRQVLEPMGFEVDGVDAVPGFHVVEDGSTFEANALKKAEALLALTGEAAVADDSGLVVDALGDAPGVHSARYAGIAGPQQDAANRRKLVAALRGVAREHRQARFVCVLAYCRPNLPAVTFRGVVEGEIIDEERGSNGFGYDPLFLVPATGRTTAEMQPDEKNALSHRGQALRALARYLVAGAIPGSD